MYRIFTPFASKNLSPLGSAGVCALARVATIATASATMISDFLTISASWRRDSDGGIVGDRVRHARRFRLAYNRAAREVVMKRRVFAGVVVAAVAWLGQVPTPASPAGTACANLAALTIPNVTVRAANVVAAGAFTPPGATAAMTLPSFCRVEATARPTSDSEIKFEVWIPSAEGWNGKFQGVGNGGYMGSITYTAM